MLWIGKLSELPRGYLICDVVLGKLTGYIGLLKAFCIIIFMELRASIL